MSDFPPPPGSQPGGVPPAQYPPTPPLVPPPSPVPPGAIRPVGQWPVAPEPLPPSGRRVPPWVVVVAVIAVVALVAGLFAFVFGDDDDEDTATRTDTTDATEEESPSTTERADDPGTTLPSGEFQAVVDEIEAFVAEERGLEFRRDVTVELADDAEFEARLLEDFEEDVADIRVAGQVLQALGLVEPGTDIVEAYRSLLGAGVVGFYDPETDELVVRGTSATPYVRAVIAHELTHALDDQHFELDRPQLEDAPDESEFGFTALVEGNAVRIENAYRATFSDDEQDEALAEEMQVGAGVDLDGIPPALAEAIIAPYLLGPDLVDAILDDGGQERLDAAFATPPTTSEALLDPPTYLEGQGALEVPAPAADGPEIDRHTIGALGLAQVLGELILILGGVGGLPEPVEGWGGDAYVAWAEGDRVCVRAHLVGDTAEDTAEIGEALQDWASDPPFDVEATIDVAEVVTLRSCG